MCCGKMINLPRKENEMKKRIITTRDINVDLSRPVKPFKQVTTKDVEVKYIDKDAPPVAPEGPMVTTKNIEDIQKKTKAENEKKKKEALKAKRREREAKKRAEKKAIAEAKKKDAEGKQPTEKE